MRRALLLVNLGTPTSTSVADVRTYLREFLLDPDVISLPTPLRYLLVEGIILRTRPKKSAAAYDKIWTERGSPLLFHSQDLAERVQHDVEADTHVALAMRYGEPSIASVIGDLHARGIDDVTVFPLYPQYSRASTKTVQIKVQQELRRRGFSPTLRFVPAFYDAPEFLDAFVAVGRRALAEGPFDKVLMSFHGYPERYLREDDPTGRHCLKSDTCCDVASDANRDCYKHQCTVTAQELTTRLGLDDKDVIVTYQSRLRDTWVRPYTDQVVVDIAKAGAKRVLAFSPAFVADCLETLEEIALRADEDFRAHGGDRLTLVPSLNSEPEWVQAVVSLARRTNPDL